MMRAHMSKDDQNDFEKEYTAKWAADPIEKYALQYHETMDAFDASIMTAVSPVTGEPIPATREQYRMSNVKCREVIQRLIDEIIQTEVREPKDARITLLNAIRRIAHVRRSTGRMQR